jgi:hypothetical protein
MAKNRKGRQTMKNPAFKMDQEAGMTKEASVPRAVRRPRWNDGTAFSLLVLVLALLGVMVAGRSQAPIISILVWPTPLVLVFTAARFIHEGFHWRDGVFVLGRPAVEPVNDLSNVSARDREQESLVARIGEGSVEASSVFDRGQNDKPGTTHGLAINWHIRKDRHHPWRGGQVIEGYQ